MPPQKVACKLCNLRRVKCDRMPGFPCSNCRVAGADCELIDSRRGKYTRTVTRRPRERERERTSPSPSQQPSASTASSSTTTEPSTSTTKPRSSNRYVSPSLSEVAVHRDSPNDAGKVVYMGDSANFKYVLHEVGDPFSTDSSGGASASARHSRFWGDTLQKSMLDRLDRYTQSAIHNLRAEDEEILRSAGAFALPRKDLSDALVDVFMRRSFPAFPLFPHDDFMYKYTDGSLSPLLLSAVYMVATFHAPETLLHEAGFASRYHASMTFYRRAKVLYDADYETDGICTLQATILMSNWWAGPVEQKDTWFWLGVAAGLAQALGMHRAKSYDMLPKATQRVWRRTWWVLYINDIHHAAVYGRPPHIHPSFCDIAPLREGDFELDAPGPSPSSSTGTSTALEGSYEGRLYLIHLADLITRVGECLVSKLSSSPHTETNQTSYDKLLQWKETLPPRFREIPSLITPETGFWPAMIHLYYCDYQIVFYRMLSETPVTVGLSSPLFEAAARVSRLLEDLVASGTLHHAPFLILPSCFASIVVHASNIRRGERDVRTISEHRAALAMHVLDRFQDMYPIAIWTRYLLDGLLRLSIGQAQGQGQREAGGGDGDGDGGNGEGGGEEGVVSSPVPVQAQLPSQSYGGPVMTGVTMGVGPQMGGGQMGPGIGRGLYMAQPTGTAASFERSISMHDVPGYAGTPGSGPGGSTSLPTPEGIATGKTGTESEGGFTTASAAAASASGVEQMSASAAVLEYWNENRLAGVPMPALYPFSNMLEDAGVDPDTCFGGWSMNPGGLE
ncbi:fungal-specific transcription factor domain-containing protein [Aspergillus pseudoustus]|uniref:Fungal-specific transcription factor domain-containing protein n=1 Tax=Aspergillus pseudoustus TaxID=1810923 RepID=A0ABR4JEB7_9EURO